MKKSLLTEEEIARVVKFARENYDSAAYRTMVINTVSAIANLDPDDLPEVSEEEIHELSSVPPTTYDIEDDI